MVMRKVILHYPIRTGSTEFIIIEMQLTKYVVDNASLHISGRPVHQTFIRPVLHTISRVHLVTSRLEFVSPFKNESNYILQLY